MEMIQAIDDWADDGDMLVHRARAGAALDQIAQQAKQALAEADIDLDLFFLIPSTGSSVLTFGTLADPADNQWDRVVVIVSSIVSQTVGLDRVWSREIACAATAAAADHPRHSEISLNCSQGGMPIPIPAPLPALDAEGESQFCGLVRPLTP